MWAADLVEMQPFSDYNDGVKYLLAVVDIFSKHRWMVLLKQKNGAAVAAAFQSIFNGGRTPKKIWVDKGKDCLLYTSPSPRDRTRSRMPSSA